MTEPALTPALWQEALQSGEDGRGLDDVFLTAGPAECHYLAALALNGQSFGFTWADVDHLREAANAVREGYSMNLWASELADRIAALLPPKEP